MDYGIKLESLLVTTLILLGLAKSQFEPDSPCPNIFKYERDSSGRWYGSISAPNPHPYVALKISVAMYITDRVPPGNNAKLELVNKNAWQILAAGNRNPVQYRLDFPSSVPLPLIKDIVINENVVCRGNKPNSRILTTLMIQHEIFNDKCDSSSLQCPYNSISQLGGTVGGGIGGGDGGGGGGGGGFDGGGGLPTIDNSPAPMVVDSGAQCGNPIIKTNPLAYYGKETQKGQWPWHAAIFHYEGFDTKYVCGGTFIGTRSILTAAHCVTISGKPREPSQLIVHLGRYNLTDRREIKEAQDIEVNYLLVHPLFNHTKLQADVAILVLQSTVKVTDMVKPACLWNFQDTSLTNIVGEKGVVVGWGQDENGKTAEELKMVVMPVVDSQICIWSNPTFFSQFTSNTTFCAGFRNGTSVCNGDSGGGLVLPRTQSDGTVIWMLRGIVSSSKARENAGKICDTKNYVIFMDVAKLLDWINAVFI